MLLFQRGERAKALPYVSAASDRGDPRAQYLLGIANFNGDNVPKDWVRAYALVTLAQQQGLPQAATGAAFSSAVGLCLFAAYPQDEWWDFDIPAERYPARSLKRAIRWFRENW